MNNPDTIESLQSLSPDELRVRVAELLGWREFQKFGQEHGLLGWKTDDEDEQSTPVPNYPASLDSCREFEDAMTDEEHAWYQGWLILVCQGIRTISARPEQRCIAFILMRQEQNED